jgi:hypothetical protein
MRFGIRNLLLLIAAVAVMCALLVVARNTYYADRRQTESALAKVKGISDVKLLPYVDIIEEVNSSSFTIDGHSGSIVQLDGLGEYADNGRFTVSRIGKWKFRVSGRRHLGAYKADSREPVESDYLGGSIEFGPNSPYKELIPFEIDTLQDLADHYGELVNLFESWPREVKPGTVTLEDGTTQFFYVIEEVE